MSSGVSPAASIAATLENELVAERAKRLGERLRERLGADPTTPFVAHEGVGAIELVPCEKPLCLTRADAETAVPRGPACHQLHPGRVNAGQAHAGEHAQHHRHVGRIGELRDGGVAPGAREGAGRDQVLRRDAIGEVEHGAEQGPDDESDLDALVAALG